MTPVSSATGMNSAGFEPPEPRMVPAQQRLEAGDGAVFEPDDRLEIDLHLAAIERAAQIGLKRRGGPSAGCASTGRNTSMRLPPRRLPWRMAISASFSMSSRLACSCGSKSATPIEAVSGISCLAESDRRRDGAAHDIGERDDLFGLGLRDDDGGELIARKARQRILRLQNAAEPPRDA